MNTRQSAVMVFLGLLAGAPLPAHAQEPTTAAPAPVIRRVVVQGARGVSAAEVAAAALTAAQGKSADSDTLRAAVRAVADLYRARSFSVAQVTDTEVTPDGTLTLTIAEGTIRRVVVRGNSKTAASVIRRAVALAAGDVYRDDRVRDARNRLARLGIFEDVVVVGVPNADETDVDPKKTDDKKPKAAPTNDTPPVQPGTFPDPNAGSVPPADTREAEPTPDTPVADEVGFIDLLVHVKEGRTGNVAATVGYNDTNGVIGFLNFSEANVYGTGNRAEIQWQRTNTSRFTSNGDFVEGRTRSAYLVAYEVPTLGPNSTAFGAEVYNTNTVFLPYFSSNRDNLRNYEIRRGGTVRVGRAFGRNGMAYLIGRRDVVGYDSVPDSLNPPITDLLNANATVASVGLKLIFDGRDDVNNPRLGYLNSLLYERSERFLGGDRPYGGLTADLRSYAPLSSAPRSPIVALRFLGGAVGSNAPLSEQFWLGGYDLLRGYDLFSIRGTRMLLTSAELRVPLGPGFQGAVFTDVGNAFLPGETVGAAKLKASGGIGLRFLTPIGPIRLDLAYGNRLQSYISLGQSY